MPAKPLIQSLRLRRLIIAMIMAAVMALSLLAAAAYCNRHGSYRAAVAFGDLLPVRVGSLETTAPGAWQRIDGPTPESARFVDPDTGDELLIARLPFDDAVNLYTALNLAINRFDLIDSSGKLTTSEAPEAFRLGAWTGLRVIGVTDNASGERAIHHVAVMTENARRFWVMHLRQNDVSSIYEGHALLAKVTSVALDHGRRDATAEEVAATGLAWTQKGDGWALRVDADHVLGEAVDMISLRGDTTQLARVAGSVAPPPGAADEATLLADYFATRLDRAPRDDERMAWQLDAGPHVTLVSAQTQALEHAGFTWAHVFVSFENRGALVAELLCPQNNEASLRDMVASVAGFLKPIWGDSLMAAGNRAASTLQRLTQLHTAAHKAYYELKRGDDPAGFGFERMVEAEPPYAWEGEAVMIFGLFMRAPAVVKWQLDAASPRFSYIRLQRAQGESDLTGYHLQQADGSLTLKMIAAGGGETPTWRVDTSSRYVSPVMTDFWPVDDDAIWQGEPALIDFGEPRKKPQPHILQRSGDAPIILMRPLTAVEADRMTIDDAGTVVEHHYRPMDAPGAATRRMVLRKVDPDELAQRYPHMRDQIRKWADSAGPMETP